MATVRITAVLIEQIVSAAGKRFENRIRVAQEEAPKELAVKIGHALRDAMRADPAFPVFLELHRLQPQWAHAEDPLDLGSVNDVALRHTSLADDIKAAVGPGPWPYGPFDFCSPDMDEAMAEYAAWRAECQNVVAEQQAFIDQVRRFLARHTTLKSALREWPHLWELVPQEAQDLHNKVVVRGKNPSVVEDERFDTSALTVALVAAKLLE